jgi:methionine-rich copper-binding protein CopC
MRKIPGATDPRRYDAAMGRILRRGMLATMLLWSLSVPVAHAQQYEDESGPLDVQVTVTVTVALAGDGFVRESVVYVTLVSPDADDPIDLGTIPTDDQGRFFGEITLEATLESGDYTIVATGVTGQGATRVLSTPITIGTDEISLTEPEATTTTLTVSEVTAAPSTTTSASDPTDAAETVASPSPAEEDNPFDRILLVRVLVFGLVGLGGVWWWLYRAVKS